MRITKFPHSCLRIEHDGAVMVIDPGVWSDAERALDGADVVLLTHEHADHVDADRLVDALAKRPQVTIHTHPAVVAKFAAQWGDAAVGVRPGEVFTAAGLPVRVYGGWHAVIHPDIPRVPNLGFLIDNSVYHPGDSFDVPEDALVETLFVPISAPWLKASEAIDFVRAVKPQRAYALHDCLLSKEGLGLMDGLLTARTEAHYTRLATGASID